jgi:fructose-1,6-bisphosphatase
MRADGVAVPASMVGDVHRILTRGGGCIGFRNSGPPKLTGTPA